MTRTIPAAMSMQARVSHRSGFPTRRLSDRPHAAVAVWWEHDTVDLDAGKGTWRFVRICPALSLLRASAGERGAQICR
jgi:hypothetical protein